jgi:outer membrane immunogenic protein
MHPKTIFAAALAASTLAGSAFAADLGARMPAPPPMLSPMPVVSWQGFYAGLDLGYAWQSLEARYGLGVAYNNFKPNGVVGGGYAGYNMQLGSTFIAGLEGDIEGGAVKQSRNTLGLATAGFLATGLPVFGNNVSVTNDFRGSVRGRIGVTFDPALLYVTGGLAYANFNTRMSWGGVYAENWNTARTGWTLGGGLEYAFTPSWIGRVEYRYSSFGNFTRWSVYGGEITQRLNDNAVRIGMAYKFGAGGYGAPVIARY